MQTVSLRLNSCEMLSDLAVCDREEQNTHRTTPETGDGYHV